MSNIPIQSVSHSNYGNMLALVGKDHCVYLGKQENYHFDPSLEEQKEWYDNTDGSLQLISDNVKIFHLLYGEGWPLSQRQLRREYCFSKRDYIEFARLRDGILSSYPLNREITFAGQPFIPPKCYKREQRRQTAPVR